MTRDTNSLLPTVLPQVTDKALKRAVRMACLNLDRRVATEGPGGNDGCTACFALVKGSHIVVCNLGDSMACAATGWVCSGADACILEGFAEGLASLFALRS